MVLFCFSLFCCGLVSFQWHKVDIMGSWNCPAALFVVSLCQSLTAWFVHWMFSNVRELTNCQCNIDGGIEHGIWVRPMSAHDSVVVQHFATLDYCAPCKCISISSTPYPHSPAGLTTEVFGHLIRSENSTCALYQPLHGNTRWGQPRTNYIRMSCWTWQKTGMSGGNLWSIGFTYRHPRCKYSYLLTYVVTYVALRQSVRCDYSLQSAVVLHSMEWWSHRLSRRHSEVLARAWSLLRMVCTIVVSFRVWSYFFQNTG